MGGGRGRMLTGRADRLRVPLRRGALGAALALTVGADIRHVDLDAVALVADVRWVSSRSDTRRARRIAHGAARAEKTG